jgi:two-component system sensor histidine kinase/response regulator
MSDRGESATRFPADPIARPAPRVLVIEDDEVVRAEIAATLMEQGFDVAEAENGRAGLWRLWDGRPDVILCDLMMPVMGGLEVLDAIRNRPEWATIPVVFLTSCDDRASMRRAMEAGADDYVTKPVVARELVSALRAALDKQDRFESEAAHRLDQFRQTLSFAVPPEFRTPLDVIFEYAEVVGHAARRRDDEHLGAVADGIRNAARQLHRITENFVIWTQLSSLRPRAEGPLPALSSSEPVALDLVVGTAARERAVQVGRSADLVCDLEPAPAYVRRQFLHKITAELVDNAFKFSAAGHAVHVITGCRGGWTQLTVLDRGDGMPPEQIEPPEDYLPSDTGGGLGLAIVRRVVALAGGRLVLDTLAEGGTAVVVTLPSVKPLDA